MTNFTKVSVIMPVYNRRHLIMRAVNSVLAQTIRSWELLIMDDGSTDGLENLILPLIPGNPQWRYCKHTRRGVAATRNLGLQAAAGEYITFLDSDDEYKPDHLTKRLDYMSSHPDVDIIHGGVELLGPPESFYVQDALNPDRKIHLSECCIGATFFGKKQAFLKSGGFKLLPYSAESEFLPRVSAIFHVEKVDFPTYIYHTGLPDSICTIVKTKNKNSEH
ncbi:glycosyltransferase family 2 protein [candidate division KSB1 bacterium]|nr:glycosyltransferase family 2 protein [candidate division KSB1 bacterium]